MIRDFVLSKTDCASRFTFYVSRITFHSFPQVHGVVYNSTLRINNALNGRLTSGNDSIASAREAKIRHQ